MPRLSDHPPRLRVVVADADGQVRRALRTGLERHGLIVCAEADDVAGAAVAARREGAHVCLLDAAIAGQACAGVGSIHAVAPEAHVVILSSAPSDEEMLDAVRAGASGHLAKTASPQALDAVIRDVIAGRSGFPRQLEKLLLTAVSRGRPEPPG